jgi:hypothetical protein
MAGTCERLEGKSRVNTKSWKIFLDVHSDLSLELTLQLSTSSLTKASLTSDSLADVNEAPFVPDWKQVGS